MAFTSGWFADTQFVFAFQQFDRVWLSLYLSCFGCSILLEYVSLWFHQMGNFGHYFFEFCDPFFVSFPAGGPIKIFLDLWFLKNQVTKALFTFLQSFFPLTSRNLSEEIIEHVHNDVCITISSQYHNSKNQKQVVSISGSLIRLLFYILKMEYPQLIKSGEEGLCLVTWKAIYSNLFCKKTKNILFCDLTYIKLYTNISLESNPKVIATRSNA